MIQKGPSMTADLSYSHYIELLVLSNIDEINYYIDLSIKNSLSYRELRKRIKSKEYERLPEETKQKLKNKEALEVTDLVPNPILVEINNKDLQIFNETVLKELIMENLDSFLKQMGEGFLFVGREYRLQDLGENRYIDMLLFNYIYNCFVVVEFKSEKVKQEDIGQIHVYMNYIDRKVKTPINDRSMGIIVSKENDKFVVKYCTDKRISFKEYLLINNEKKGIKS